MPPLVMNGKITVTTGGLNEVACQFKAGKLQPIGISSPERRYSQLPIASGP